MRILLVSLVILTSCGRNTSTPTPVAPQSAANQKPANIANAAEGQPRYLLVRVPLDSSGKEMTDAAESRSVSDVGTMTSGSSAQAAFDLGKSVTVGDELDKTSSTESWGWYNPWYPGKLLGRGSWWGRNPYLYYNNYYYGYNYGNSYNYGNQGCGYSRCGFNYYSYYNY
jgi:hypothetical protein